MYQSILYNKLGTSEADVRLKLAEEDDKAIADGRPALHAVTPAAMLIDLLEIEELQSVYMFLHSGPWELTTTLDESFARSTASPRARQKTERPIKTRK